MSTMMASQPLPTIGDDDLLEIDFAMEDRLLVTRAKELAHLCFVHFDLDDEEAEEEEDDEEEVGEGEDDGRDADNDHELVSVAEDAVRGLAPLEVSTATSLPLPPPNVHAHTDSPRSAQSKTPSPMRSITRAIAARSYHDGTIKEAVGVRMRRRERLAGKCRAYRPP